MSGRPCSACGDARRPGLDAAIASGTSFRAIARQFAPLSRDAIRRHRPHVTKTIVKAAAARRSDEAETLLQKVERLEADARRLGEKAEAEGDLRAALVAVHQLLDVVRLMHEMQPQSSALPTGEALHAVIRRAAEQARASRDAQKAEWDAALEKAKAEARAEILLSKKADA
jgi:hypothetical protein